MRPGALIALGAAPVGIIGAAFLVFGLNEADVARGRVLYDVNCASCHGGNLEGQPDWQLLGPDGRLPAPPHDASGHSWHHSDAVLIAYITLGGTEAMAQMGVALDSGMPGFGDVLSPDEITDILAFIKSHWPERERDYQAEQNITEGE